MSKRAELLDQLKIDRTEPAPRGMRPIGVVLLVALAVALGGIGAALFMRGGPAEDVAEASPAAGRPAAAAAEAASPVAGNAPLPARAAAEDNRILNASGYITARRIATVSSQITGLITEVRVEEGMIVETGQVLAQLDDALARVDLGLAEARLASQRAAIDSVRANLAEAERVYERARRLRGENLVSEADLTESSARVDSLSADLKRSEADIAVIEFEIARQREQLLDHVITAPFGGVVTVKNAQPGEIVSPVSAGGGFTRTGICTIVDMDSLEIEVDVNEAFIGRVFSGQRVVANLDAYPDWDIPASVIAIIPTADRAKATVKVRIGIEARDPRILPDMGVKVAFLRNEGASG